MCLRISEGGPGVRGQRPRVLPLCGTVHAAAHDGDIGRLKIAVPRGWEVSLAQPRSAGVTAASW